MTTFFSKLGAHKRRCEWLPILIVRVFAGIFLILSGFTKLFSEGQHAQVLNSLKAANFPYPEISAYVIPAIELVGGLFLLFGFLTTLTSFFLFVVMIVAIFVDGLGKLSRHEGLIRLENFLYLPEFLYALLFLWLFFSGPGKVSFDASYGKKKRLH